MPRLFLAAGVDDAILNIASNPAALGLFAFIFIAVYLTGRMGVRFATKAIDTAKEMAERASEIYKSDNNSSNKLLDKLVESSSRGTLAFDKMITVVENNTEALRKTQSATEALQGSVDRLDMDTRQMSTDVNSAITSIQTTLIALVATINELKLTEGTALNELRSKIDMLLEQVSALQKSLGDKSGTSDSTNTDTAGQSGTNPGD